VRSNLRNIRPGEVLLEEFLVPLKISGYKLSKDLSISQTRIYKMLKGNGCITADTALRLSKYFGNSPRFWLTLQNDYDLEEERMAKKEILKMIKAL